MSEDRFMLVSLEDSKSKAIAEVIGSKTCKKIINYLAEKKEASQKDLSDALDIPMNTLDYNVKKLLESGFVQKRKNFFWSKKGKKIIMYELSNKSIVFSPKKVNSEKIKSILPAFILTLAGTFAIWVFEKIKYAQENIASSAIEDSSEILMEKATGVAEATPQVVSVAQDTILTPHPTPIWLWFLAGALLSILIISIVNWRKL